MRSLFWVIVFSAFFFFFLNHRVFIHDMFNFIRHSPFLSFDKRQKLHIHTYTYTCIYIDIYKSKNHSSIKIQTARFMYNIILIIVVIRLVLKYLSWSLAMCKSRPGWWLKAPTPASWRQCTIDLSYWPDNVPHTQQLNQTPPDYVPIYTLADQEVPLTVNIRGVS